MYKLYSNPSFTEGLARTVDFDGNLQVYNFSRSTREADARAIYSDFFAIGEDMMDACKVIEQENVKEKIKKKE